MAGEQSQPFGIQSVIVPDERTDAKADLVARRMEALVDA